MEGWQGCKRMGGGVHFLCRTDFGGYLKFKFGGGTFFVKLFTV